MSKEAGKRPVVVARKKKGKKGKKKLADGGEGGSRVGTPTAGTPVGS